MELGFGRQLAYLIEDFCGRARDEQVGVVREDALAELLQRIIQDEISTAWERYLRFAIYVVGISSGVRVWDLEKYITPSARGDGKIIELTRERWMLESFRSVMSSLEGTVMLLRVFHLCADCFRDCARVRTEKGQAHRGVARTLNRASGMPGFRDSGTMTWGLTSE